MATKTHPERTDQATTAARRRLLKGLAAGGGTALGAALLPEKWKQPVIRSTLLPAHAQSTPRPGCSFSQAENEITISIEGTQVGVCAQGFGEFPGTASGTGDFSATFNNVPFGSDGCTLSLDVDGTSDNVSISGDFTFTINCPGGECTGSGEFDADKCSGSPSELNGIYVGTFTIEQECCDDPEFVFGETDNPVMCLTCT